MIDGYSVLVLEYKEMKMENKQTIVVDEDLLNQIVETKVSELLEKKEKAILEHAGTVVRNIINQFIKENDVIEKTVNRELDISNPNSILHIAVSRKADSWVENHVNRMYDGALREHFRSAIEKSVLQNSGVVGILYPTLTEMIVDDSNFKKTLQGHVELALKAKIEKFLNKSTYSLADELFDQFVEKCKEKRGEL